ncbi:MAG: hypothetical protein GX877_00960 [Bacteroidales bacterium]|nr:hypothetical protein [Bacteroidales bacterium]
MGKKERFLTLATVRKTFGREGELFLKFHPGVSRTLLEQRKESEPVFICIDGIPVPFFITSLQPVGNDKAVVCFENYSSQQLAQEWVGETLMIKEEEEGEGEDGTRLIGYSFQAKTAKGDLLKGTVSQFFDYPMNPCLELEFEDGTRSLLPFHSTFVKKTDHRNASLRLSLPEGL